jgi:hypothetical protein
MHKYYLEFIYAYYYLIFVAYLWNYLKFKKVKSYVIKVYGLIEIDSILLSRSYERSLWKLVEKEHRS